MENTASKDFSGKRASAAFIGKEGLYIFAAFVDYPIAKQAFAHGESILGSFGVG